MSSIERKYVNETELAVLTNQRRKIRNMVIRKVGIKQGQIWLRYLADVAESDWGDDEVVKKVIQAFITIGYKREDIAPVICLTVFNPKNN